MNRNHKMIGTVVSLIAAVVVLSALEADAGGSPSDTWFKPPWPCVLVRADVPGMPRFGVCPSPRVARQFVASPVGKNDGPIVLTPISLIADAEALASST